MPELPEVETIRRQLGAHITGKTVKRVRVRYPKVVYGMGAVAFRQKIRGKKIKEVGRRGKLILIRLAGDVTLVVHLKMTGRMLLDRTYPRDVTKSTEVVFEFADGSHLFYDDIRRFGYMNVVPTVAEGVLVQKEKLGIDFFDRALTFEKFKKLIRSRGLTRVKPLLMDQTLIAGIGNVYAQEACFDARVHPQRKAASLTDKELRGIYAALHRTMKKSITYRGSSVDVYVDAFGKRGGFVPYLQVYGREGKPCVRCTTKLVKQSIGGRGSVFCPQCQK